MSHFWDVSFFQECFCILLLWSALWPQEPLTSFDWTSGALKGPFTLAVGWPSIPDQTRHSCMIRVRTTMTVTGTSAAWPRWWNDSQLPLTTLEHSQLHFSPSGAVPLLLGFLKWFPNVLESPGANKMGYFQDENFAEVYSQSSCDLLKGDPKVGPLELSWTIAGCTRASL